MTSDHRGDRDASDPLHRDVPGAFVLTDAERYTMAQAAAVKGVSYHTVSRAVRQGRLPVNRLGRMALIGGQDLANWEPMRERAPRRHRQAPVRDRSPSPALEKALGGRIEIAKNFATMFEVIHGASSELPLEQLGKVLADRFSITFGLTRLSLWISNPRDGSGRRLASIGPPISTVPDTVKIQAGFTRIFSFIDLGNARVSLDPRTEFGEGAETSEQLPRGPILIVPLRARERTIGAIFGDRDGLELGLDQDQLTLARAVGNQVALAVDHAALREDQRFRLNQLSAILDQMSDQVRACDTEGRLNLINRTDKIFTSGDVDRSPEIGSDALSNPNVRARHELDGTLIPRERHPLARALRGEIIQDWEYDVTLTDGRVQRAQVSARPIIVDGEVTGAVYIGRNISERRERERRSEERIARLEREVRYARALAGSIARVTALASSREVMQVGLECLCQTLDDRSGIALAADEHGRFAVSPTVGVPPGLRMPELDNPIAISTTILALSRQAPVAVSMDEAGRAEREVMSMVGASGLLVVPVQSDHQPIAAFHVFHDEQHPHNEDELTFASAIAHLCAQAIDRLRMRDQLCREQDVNRQDGSA